MQVANWRSSFGLYCHECQSCASSACVYCRDSMVLLTSSAATCVSLVCCQPVGVSSRWQLLLSSRRPLKTCNLKVAAVGARCSGWTSVWQSTVENLVQHDHQQSMYVEQNLRLQQSQRRCEAACLCWHFAAPRLRQVTRRVSSSLPPVSDFGAAQPLLRRLDSKCWLALCDGAVVISC